MKGDILFGKNHMENNRYKWKATTKIFLCHWPRKQQRWILNTTFSIKKKKKMFFLNRLKKRYVWQEMALKSVCVFRIFIIIVVLFSFCNVKIFLFMKHNLENNIYKNKQFVYKLTSKLLFFIIYYFHVSVLGII